MAKQPSIKAPRPRPAVRKMSPYIPPTGGRAGKLRLDFNENTVGCSPRVLRALKQHASRELLSVYPEYEGARQSIAPFFGVKPEQMTFSDGTDEAIQVLANTYVDDGDEAVIPWPTFPIFRVAVEISGGTPRLVPYQEPDLAFPLRPLLESITRKTRLVLIANPNNPTGSAIGLAEIETILRKARRAAVLIDEAYFEFYGVTALKLLKRYPNLFVSRTFSKVYGMAGLRVGCVFSQAENISAFRKVQSPYSVNSLAVICAIEAVQDQDYIRTYVEEVLESRDILRSGLDRLGLPHFATEANFVLVKFGARAKDVYQGLREKGLLVRDRSHEVPGTIRITSGKKSQVRKLLRLLPEVMKSCGY